jgi:hypothetical protein
MSNLVILLGAGLATADQPVTVLSLPSISVNRDWIDLAAFAVSVILTVVGIVGVRAAVRTLKAVEKQTGQMIVQAALMKEQTAVAKQAADAALLNAQAVINAERPWLLVAVPRLVMSAQQSLHVSFKTTNVGRSPAEIIFSATEWRTYLTGQQLGEAEPFFSESAPLESQWAHTEWKAPGEDFNPPSCAIDSASQPDRWKMLRDGIHVLVLMGFVRYRDAISFGIHESRFCYAVSLKLDSIVMTGPQGYNRLT